MKAIASSDGATINSLAWSIFWRFGLGYAIATNLVLGGMNFAYTFVTMFLLRGSGLSNEEASRVLVPGQLPWWLGLLSTLVMLVVAFFILRWVLRALYGKNIGGKTFLLAVMSNDRD